MSELQTTLCNECDEELRMARHERDLAKLEAEQLRTRVTVLDVEAAHYRDQARLASEQRAVALAKAEQYEKDWMAAKNEFGETTSKLRAQVAELRNTIDAMRDG